MRSEAPSDSIRFRTPVTAALSVGVAAASIWASGVRIADVSGWVGAVSLACLAFGLASSSATFRRLGALGCGLGLAVMGMLHPPTWLAAGGVVVLALVLAHGAFRSLAPPAGAWTEYAAYAGLGCGFPAIVLGGIALVGGEDSVRALRSTFASKSTGWTPSQICAVVVVSILALAALDAIADPAGVTRERHAALGAMARILGAALVALFAVRLAWVVSVAVLPTDTVTWSEPPLLVNMLKLKGGIALYGPMADANSYTYSPGTDLLHYALLRPLGLELSVRAHRMLAFAWQALATVVLTLAVRKPLEPALRSWFGRGTVVVAVSAVGNAVWSGMNAPNAHPDHVGKACFALAVALAVALPRLSARWLVAGLILIPPVATSCKLTAAGIGVGLALALIWERRPRWLIPLALGGAGALATIPLFDATLGSFSLYAIRVQSSHPMQWHRIWHLLVRPEGKAILVVVAAIAILTRGRPRQPLMRAAVRVLLVTAGFAATSLVAWLKKGGLENNLVVLTMGATAAALLVAAQVFCSTARGRVAVVVTAICLWVGLGTASPAPVLGARRAELLSAHQRSIAWLREQVRLGRHPLPYFGAAAWIEAGQCDVPRDQLPSALELYLGGWPQLAAHVTRLFDGTYDSMILSAAAVEHNPLLLHLRPRLQAEYDWVGEPDGVWPAEPHGLVILTKKAASQSPSL